MRAATEPSPSAHQLPRSVGIAQALKAARVAELLVPALAAAAPLRDSDSTRNPGPRATLPATPACITRRMSTSCTGWSSLARLLAGDSSNAPSAMTAHDHAGRPRAQQPPQPAVRAAYEETSLIGLRPALALHGFGALQGVLATPPPAKDCGPARL